MMKNKLVIGAAALAASGLMAANAGVLASALSPGPVSTLTEFGIGLDWTIDNLTAENYTTVDTYWTVSIDLVPLVSGGPNAVIVVNGQHNAAPHGGELAPNPLTYNKVFVIPPDGIGSTDSAMRPHPVGLDYDQWDVAILAGLGGADYKVTVEAQHVPEPHEYAMMAGLGLMAFGAYRRFRRA